MSTQMQFDIKWLIAKNARQIVLLSSTTDVHSYNEGQRITIIVVFAISFMSDELP